MGTRLSSEEIEAIATDWIIREDRGPLSPDECEALDLWLGQDSRHLGAYVRGHAILDLAAQAAALDPTLLTEGGDNWEEKEDAPVAGAGRVKDKGIAGSIGRAWFIVAGVGAGILMLGLGLGLMAGGGQG